MALQSHTSAEREDAIRIDALQKNGSVYSEQCTAFDGGSEVVLWRHVQPYT